MAEATTITINIIILILPFSSLPWTSSGFSLKLIHRDSPLSLLYQPNVSDFLRFHKNAEITQSRASYLQQQISRGSSKAKQNASIRLPAKLQDPIFTVEIGIGTPPLKRTLLFDTGSGLTWTQCKPCSRCFRQNDSLFDPQRSSSYKPLDRNHPLSGGFTCTPFGCGYYNSYYSGQYTSGNAAIETFTFQSNPRSPASVPSLVFGCGTSNAGNYPPAISGLLGMNRRPTSFARQLEKTTGKARFSYCLSTATTSYVRFGDEARIKGWWTKKTPFSIARGAALYGLNLIDLSFNGRKLGLKQAAFPDGCIIDSGASVSLLNKRAYSAVTDLVAKYFAAFKDVKRYLGNRVSEKFMCYSFPAGFRRFPSMAFHFKGADYQVPAANVFYRAEGNVFCLAMMESKETTILGAFQQRNVRIVYDLKDSLLSFASEDCSKDARI